MKGRPAHSLGDLDAIRRQADEASLTLEESSSSIHARRATATSTPGVVATPPAARHDATRSAGPSARSDVYGLMMLRAGRTDALVAGRKSIHRLRATRTRSDRAEPGRKHVSAST